jgi:hypothetical protein
LKKTSIPCELLDYQCILDSVNQLLSAIFHCFLTVEQSIFYLGAIFRVVLQLVTTVALWLVADFEALTYQDTPNFNKSKNLEISTATAINYSAC